MVNLTAIMLLLFLFQIKHYICDYPLQGKYMLGKFHETDWKMPLLAHASVHMLGTIVVVTIYSIFFGISTFSLVPFGMLLGCLDLWVHYGIDRWKVLASKQTNPSESKFWHLLGIDQMLHHFTHYIFIFLLVI